MRPKGIPNYLESPISDATLRAKYQHLCRLIQPMGQALVAFSGGADSALLAGVTRNVLGRNSVTAYLAIGPSLPEQEREEAVQVSHWLDVRLVEYSATEFENPHYIANGPDRCYHCKADLFQHLRRFAEAFPQAHLLYGGNADDTQDYRPGHLAAQKYGARAPLAEAHLTKAEVRALSQIFNLPTADKPAQPCLSSRIPYGHPVDKLKLGMIESGEKLLQEMGFREFRLRHYGDLARLEVPVDQFALWGETTKKEILFSRLNALGFKQIEIDPLGFRSGSLNEGLVPAQKVPVGLD